MNKAIIVLIVVLMPAVCLGYSKTGTVYTLDTIGGDDYQTDFINAHAGASAGDTINIPSGSFAWDSNHTITKAIHIVGAGAGITTIDCTAADQAGDSSDYVFIFAVPSGGTWSLSGIAFIETHATYFNSGGIISISASNAVQGRIHHCTFTGINSRVIQAERNREHSFLIDNNAFTNWADLGEQALIRPYGDNESAWANSENVLGGAGAIFMEDNTISHSGSVAPICDVEGGGKLVVRYNTITNGYIGQHGLENSSGSLFMEVYENSFIINLSASNEAWIQWGGGTGVVYNNRVDLTGGYSWWRKIHVFNYCFCQRTDNCGELRQCHEAVAEVETCTGGYPCKNQQGRGPNQVLMPMYVWGNTVDTGSGYSDFDNGAVQIYVACDACDDSIGEDMSGLVVEGRDYYEDIVHPTWTPYTYPHPLREEPTPTPGPDGASSGGCFVSIGRN